MHTVRRGVAAAGSSVFFVLAPGVVAGVVPWLLTGWRARRPLPYSAPLRVAGVALLAAAALVLVQAFRPVRGGGGWHPSPGRPQPSTWS